MDSDKDWILNLAGREIERLIAENKILTEKNTRLLESLTSISRETVTTGKLGDAEHNICVALSWVADLLPK